MGLLVVLCQSQFPDIDGYIVVVQESVFLFGKCPLEYRGLMTHQVYNLCQIVQKRSNGGKRGRCNRVKLGNLGEKGIADLVLFLQIFCKCGIISKIKNKKGNQIVSSQHPSPNQTKKAKHILI